MTKRERTKKMNVSKQMIKAVKAKAMMSTPLRKALKEWFENKGASPYPEVKDFGVWLEKEIDFVALMVRTVEGLTDEEILSALWVETIGDRNAVHEAEMASRKGWETDTCCYVEDGMVNASVWLSGQEGDMTARKAEEIANKFRELGYSDVSIDKENDTDITVGAVIGFRDYLASQKKGGR